MNSRFAGRVVRAVKARVLPEGHGAANRHRKAAGRCFLDMLGVFAEFETSLRGERQFEGIARASPIAKASSWVARRSIAC
jgi:hypothetical protein